MADISVEIIETDITGTVVDGDTITASVTESAINATVSLSTEIDPVFIAHDAFGITAADILLLTDLSPLAVTDGNIIIGDGSNWIVESGATARASLGLSIGSQIQAWDTHLDDIAGLTPTDGNFIVGDGTNWITESGNTARTSLGLGTGDSPTFTGLTLGDLFRLNQSADNDGIVLYGYDDRVASIATMYINSSGETLINASGNLLLSGNVIVSNSKTIIDVTNTEAFLVRKDADAGDVFVVDTTNGRVGIGIVGPTTSLDIRETTISTANKSALNILLTVSPGSSPAAQYRGAYIKAKYTSAHDAAGFITGVYAIGEAADNRNNIVAGILGEAIYSGADVAALGTSLYGGRFQARNTSTGRITHGIGIKISSGENASGTIDDLYGLYIAAQSAGTLNSALHIEGAGVDNSITFSGVGGSGINAKIYSTAANALTIDASVGLTLSTGNLILGTNDIASVGNITASDLFRINQSADEDGIIVYGYDDRSASYIDMNVLSTGDSRVKASGTLYLWSAGGNIISVLGDNAGAKNFRVTDSGFNEVASINSLGRGIFQGNQIIDTTATEALLIRKDADAGDVFVVDSTNGRVGINRTPVHLLDISQLADSYGLRVSGYDDMSANTISMSISAIGESVFTSTGSLVFGSTTGYVFFNSFNHVYLDLGDNDGLHELKIRDLANNEVAMINSNGQLSLREQASAGADTAAFGQLWVKSDTPNILMFTDDAGTDFTVDLTPV